MQEQVRDTALSERIKNSALYRYARSAYLAFRSRLIDDVYVDRVVLDRATVQIISTLPISSMDALEISGNKWAKFGFRSFQSREYPDYDVCEKPLAESFDLIIAEQVFEHLLWPHRAAKNVYAMLRPNGYFLVTTPFLQKIHNYPVDCSRWTETGIKYLLADAGFHLDDIRTWSWGNRTIAKANLNPRRLSGFPRYNPILHRNLKNESLFPVQVWALARRSA
jgi:SAM-dependent methyltransferase